VHSVIEKYQLLVVLVLTLLLSGCGDENSESENITLPDVSERANAFGSGVDYGPFNEYVNLAAELYSGTPGSAVLDENTVGTFLYQALFEPAASPERLPRSINVEAEDFSETEDVPYHNTPHYQRLYRAAELLADDAYSRSSSFNPICGNREGESRFIRFEYLTAESRAQILASFDLPGTQDIIVYDNCQIGSTADDTYLTGVIRIFRPTTDQAALVPYVFDAQSYLAYDYLEIRSSDAHIVVVGVEKWSGQSSCPKSEHKTSFLSTYDINTGAEYLAADLNTTRGTENSPQNCVLNSPEPNTIDGWIYQRGLGGIEVETMQELQFGYRNRRVFGRKPIEEVDSRQLAGELKLHGANGSAFFRQFVDTRWSRSGFSEPFAVFGELEFEQDAGEVITHRMLLRDVWRGGFHDMRDDDADGIPNKWEEAFDLNPNDAADALLDGDQDGLNTLEEYRAVAHPGDSRDRGLRINRSVEIIDVVGSPGHLAPYTGYVETRILNPARRLLPRGDNFELIIRGECISNGSISPEPSCELGDKEAVSLVSTSTMVPTDEIDGQVKKFNFVAQTASALSVSARFSQIDSGDDDPDNDFDEFQFQVPSLNSDYSISIVGNDWQGEPELQWNEKRPITVKVTQHGDSDGGFISLKFGRLLYPEEWYRNNTYTFQSEHADQYGCGRDILGCQINGLDPGESIYFDFYLFASPGEQKETTFSLHGDVNDTNGSNDVVVVRYSGI